MDLTSLTSSSGASAALQSAVAQSANSPDVQKVRKTAQQFEGFFVGQMMDTMMAGVDVNPIFGGGYAEETWRSMLNQQYGQEVAKTGRVGIADSVMKAMLQAQEQATTGNASAAAAATTAPSTTGAADNAPPSSAQTLSAAALAATTQKPVEEE